MAKRTQGRPMAGGTAPMQSAPVAVARRAGSMVRAWLLGTTALLPASGAAIAQVAPNARPTGGAVVAGSASVAQGASQTTVTQSSQRAAVEWQQFNVGSQHTVQFIQPNAQAATLNRVVGPDPSVIAGRIRANTPDGGVGGMVAVVNQSGVVFANGSQVSVGSLIASASNVTNQNFMAGRMVFDGPARPGARVENHGTITVADRGLAALVGPRVANTGLIQGRLARVALQGGAETYSLDLAGDGMLAIDVTQAVRGSTNGVALATNSGVIEAPGGSVLISAHAASGLVEDLVRNTGRIRANTQDGRTGQVALRAEGGNVRIEGGVEARGAAPGQAGGRIEATASGGSVTVAAGARVSASGDAPGGSVQIGGRTTREARVEGTVAARSRNGRGGRVAVQAAEAVTLAPGAVVDVSGAAGGGTALLGTEGVGRGPVMAARTTVAAGATVRADATAAGDGGLIVVNSSSATEALGLFSARGGTAAGNGGFLELSGQGRLTIAASIDLGAPAGRQGTLLLDPDRIEVTTAVAAGGSTFTATDTSTPGTLQINPADIVGSGGNFDVTLLAARSITVNNDIIKSNGNLTLEVNRATTATDNGIFVNAAIALTGPGHSLTLRSTSDGTAPQGVVSIAGNLSVTGNGSVISVTGGSIATSGTAALTTNNDNISLTAAAGIALGGGAVSVAGAGSTITLDAGTSISTTGTASISANAGAVSLTAATSIDLGGGTVRAGNGRTLSLSGTEVSTSGSATLGFNGSGNGTVAITATGTGAAGGISLGAGINAGTGDVTLLVAPDKPIAQTGAAIITAGSLVAGGVGGRTTDLAGSIALGNANLVDNLTARATDSIAFRSDAAFYLVGTASGRGVTLTNGLAGGGISISGTVTGRRAAGGSQDVTLVADAIDINGSVSGSTVTLRPFSNDTSVTLGDAGTLHLSGLSLGNVTADLLSIRPTGTGSIVLTGDIDVRTGVQALELLGAAITQSSGTLLAPAVRAVASNGSVGLAGLNGNQIGAIAGSATGDFVAVSDGSMSVGSVAGSTGTSNGISTGPTGTTVLFAQSGDLTQTQPITGGGRLQLAAATGNITFGDAGNRVSVLASSPGGNLTFVNGQALEIGTAGSNGVGIQVGSGRTADLQATGGLTQTQSITGGGNLVARVSGGSVALTDAGNRVAAVAGSASGGFAFTNDGSLSVGVGTTGIAAGSSQIVALTVTGASADLSQTQPITGNVQLLARSDAGVDLGSTSNQVAVVAGSARSFAVGSSQTLDVGTVGGFSGISTAPGVGSIDLHTAAGDVTQSVAITAAQLRARADGGNVAFGTLANQIDSVSGSALDGFAVNNLTALAVGGTGISGGTGGISLVSGDSITIGAPVVAASGTRVTLRADDMAINALVSAPGGEINLRVNTAGVGVTLGGPASGTGLTIGTSEIANLGNAAAPAARLRITSAAEIDLAGNATLRPRVAALALEAGTSITQSAGNLDVARLVASADSSISVARAGSTNTIDAVAATIAGGLAGTVAVAATGGASLAVINDTAVPFASGISGIGGAVRPASVTLSGNAVALGADVDATTVTLAASGAITQSGGALLAGTLNVQGLAGGGSAAGSVVLEAANNQISTLSGTSATGLLAVRSDVATFTVGGTVASTGGDVRLTNGLAGGTLVVASGTVDAPAGTASVIADGFDFGASGVRVSGDSVGIGPFSALDVQVGGILPPANTLLLDSALFARLSATTRLILGSASSRDVTFAGALNLRAVVPELQVIAGRSIQQNPGATLDVATLQADAGRSQAAGGVKLDGASNLVDNFGASAGASGNIAFTSLFDLQVTGITGGTAPGTSVTLTSTAGGLSQSGGITGRSLVANAFGFGGDVLLESGANTVGSVAGTADTNFRVSTTGDLDVGTGGISARTMALTSQTGSITQSGGLSGTNLVATASSGSVTLNTQFNTVANVGGTAGGSFAYGDDGSFAVTGITAGTTVTLSSTLGTITQSGRIQAGTLSAAANGSVILTDLTNQVANVGGSAGAGGAFRYTGSDGFDVTGIGATGATVALTALGAGSITQSGRIQAATLSATAGDSVTLTDPANQSASVGGSAGTGGAFRYTDTDGFAVTGISVPSGTVALVAGSSGSITQGGTIQASTLSATAGVSVSLTATNNQVGSVTGTATTGDFSYTGGGGFDVGLGGIAASAGTVTLTAGGSGDLTQSGRILASTLSATAGGAVVLENPSNQAANVGGSAGTGAAFRYTDTDGFDVTGILAPSGTVSLTAGGSGDVTQSGRILASTLTADAGGSVTLLASSNQVANVGGSAGTGGEFRYADTDGFAVTGISAAGGTVALAAGGTGSITQSGAIETSSLSATAGGSVTLLASGNQVATVGGSAGAGGDFRYADTDGFDVTGISAPGTVALTAGGTGSITQSGRVQAGTLSAAAGGSVTLTDPTNQAADVGGSAGTGGEFRYTDTDGFAVTGISAAGGTVVLTAGATGSITQGGTIEAGTLSANAGGSVTLLASGNQVANVGGSAGTGGDFRYADADGFDVTGISAPGTVALTAGGTGSITQSGRIQAGTLSAVAGGSVTLTDLTNQVANVGGSAGAGGEFRYTDTDGFAVTGIGATGGTVALTARGPGSITQTGAIQAGSLSATAGGAVTLTNSGNQVTSLGGRATAGDFRYTDTDGFDISSAGINASGTIVLTAGGTGTVTQTGSMQGAALLIFSGGSVSLDTQGNQLANVGGTAQGDFRYQSADGFNVTGITAAAAVDLATLAGSITQTGVIQGTTLTAAAAGSVNLGTLANQVSTGGGEATSGSFDLRTAGSLTVTGITAGTAVGLASDSGSISQSGAILGKTAPIALVAAARGAGQSVALDGAANQVGSVAGAASSGFAVLSNAALRVTTLSSAATGPAPISGVSTTGAGGTVDLRTTSGRLDQDAPIQTSALRVGAAGGPVDLTAATNLVSTVAGVSDTSFGLRNGQSLTVGTVLGTAGITAPSVDLHVTSGNLGQTAAITAPVGLQVRADAGAVALNAGNAVGVLAGSAAGDFGFVNVQALTIGARPAVSGVTSTGAGATRITLATTAGDLVQNGGDIIALGSNASVSLSGAGTVSQLSGIIATRRLGVQGGAGVQLGNANQFEQLTGASFGASGGVLRGQSYTVSGDVVATGNLALQALGGISVGAAGVVPSITSTAGGITVTSDAGPIGIGPSQLRALGGALTLTGATGVSLTGTQLNAAGNIAIAAPGGSVTLSNASARTGGDMGVTAGGNITLSTPDLLAGGALSLSARGTLGMAGGRLVSQGQQPTQGLTLEGLSGVSIQGAELTAATRLTIRDAPGVAIDATTLTADTALIEGPTITLGAVRAVIGTGMLLRAPGGVTSTQPLIVQPRVQGQFPAVIFDTRTLPPQTADAILAYVRPDLPGLQPDQQPTQLTSTGGGVDVFFGRASAAPAGAVALNVQAPGSAIFLLLDGGAATGNIVAGRLLVHGTGGSTNLFGTLSGIGGAGAARASDITQPSDPGSLTDYRINSCVIGSVNCVVAPRFQPIPPTVRTNVDFIFRQNAFNPADVIIPNTGEDDYE